MRCRFGDFIHSGLHFGAEVGEQDFAARKRFTIVLDIGVANMSSAGFVEVCALAQEKVCVFAFPQQTIGPGGVPREDQLLAVGTETVAQRDLRFLVRDLETREVKPANLGLASIHHFDELQREGESAAPTLPVEGIEKPPHATLGTRRPDDDKGTISFSLMFVLKQQKGEACEMVSVQVAESDTVEGGHFLLSRFELRQNAGASFEQDLGFFGSDAVAGTMPSPGAQCICRTEAGQFDRHDGGIRQCGGKCQTRGWGWGLTLAETYRQYFDDVRYCPVVEIANLPPDFI